MQTSDTIERIATVVVEKRPGTIKHITCTREDAGSLEPGHLHSAPEFPC
jgi:hypothetical protein